ncbi:MAG: hypothetical protein KF726_19865 [Anaerolineae bacterium]|nr:hypothetical protein [Anaerolineae bacterium]
MLPDSLHPLPADLAQKFAASSMSAWSERVLHWVEDREDVEAIEISDQASSWLYRRRLMTSHLKWSPKIWFWNDGINFHIEWDNRRYQENSISVWDAQVGHWSATVEEFIEEVRAFDSQFIQAMQQRVDQISANGMPKDVLIDIESLKAEQVDRAKWLERSLEAALHQPPDDWEAIRAAIEVIEAK